jgi:hypothetical protein
MKKDSPRHKITVMLRKATRRLHYKEIALELDIPLDDLFPVLEAMVACKEVSEVTGLYRLNDKPQYVPYSLSAQWGFTNPRRGYKTFKP